MRKKTVNRYLASLGSLWALTSAFMGLWLVVCIWSIDLVSGRFAFVFQSRATTHRFAFRRWPLQICIAIREFAGAAGRRAADQFVTLPWGRFSCKNFCKIIL
jgi:hypothetical protein